MHLLLSGLVSWFYPADEYGNKAVCATNDQMAIGRKLEIFVGHHHANCVDIGLGPFVRGRVADVSPVVRDELGIGSQGVAYGRVYLVPR